MAVEPYRGELEQFDPYWLERMYAEWEEVEQYIEDEDVCPHCEGDGVIIVGFDDNPDVYENIEETCPHCNGNGHYKHNEST